VLEERWPYEVLITMVESNAKKCAFLRHVSRLCEMNTRIANKRIESLTDSDVERPMNVLTARALAPVAKLLDLVEKIPVRPQRMLFLKGQHVDVELTEATKCWNISFSKHPSKLSADGCILDISEAERVNPTALQLLSIRNHASWLLPTRKAGSARRPLPSTWERPGGRW
jgi:hypothetical protein